MKKVLALLLMASVAQGSLLLGTEYENLQTHLSDSAITRECLEVSQDWLPYNVKNSFKALECCSLNYEFNRIQQAYDKIKTSQLDETHHKILNYLDSKEQIDANRSRIDDIIEGADKVEQT